VREEWKQSEPRPWGSGKTRVFRITTDHFLTGAARLKDSRTRS